VLVVLNMFLGERTSGLSDAGQSMQVLLEKHSSFDYASPSGEPETIARSRSCM